MPNITEYRAPPLDLNPAERGVSAWDAAARRIGAFYGDVAGSQRAQGSLAAQALKQKLWPFDILALYDAQAKGAASGGGGGGVRVRGAGSTFGGPTESFAEFGQSRNTGAPAGMDDFGQVLAGAAALGRGLADGGYQAARMRRGGATGGGGDGETPIQAGGGGPDYTLLNGEFVTARQNRQADIDQRDAINKEMQRYTNEAVDVGNYWRRYYGETNPGGGYDPNTNYPTGPVNGPIPPPIPDAPAEGGSILNPLNWF